MPNYTYYTNPYSHIDVFQHIENQEYNFYHGVRELIPLYLWPLYLTIFISYYPLMRLGQSIMAKREPFSLKLPLFLWNMFVSFMSGICAYELGKLLMYLLINHPTHEKLVCNRDLLYTRNQGWYILMFVISKFFELIDTIFLVLRKKKILPLHWIHHLTTAIYGTHAVYFSYYSDSTQLYYVFMNTFVHTFMYFYYGMTAIGYYFNMNYLITVIQLIQMVVGLTVSISSIYCKHIDHNYFGLMFISVLQMYYIVSFSKVFMIKYNEKKMQKDKTN